jgi:hypothetical protein
MDTTTEINNLIFIVHVYEYFWSQSCLSFPELILQVYQLYNRIHFMMSVFALWVSHYKLLCGSA